MANVRLIKRRIKSAKNIAQITKAMELVAASKMKKAQLQAIAGKMYAQKIYELVMRVSGNMSQGAHPLLKSPLHKTGRQLVIIISTNKGLCGGLNSVLFRFAHRTLGDFQSYDWLSLGKKGAKFLAVSGGNLLADFSNKTPFSLQAQPVTDFITHQYLTQKYDSVSIVYNEFISALRQIPRLKTLLPLQIDNVSVDSKAQVKGEYVVDPDPETLLSRLLPHYLENQVRDAILQAEASEHSARMIAMRSATDNAKSFVYDLSLQYNKARQEKITYEISDMVTARLAFE